MKPVFRLSALLLHALTLMQLFAFTSAVASPATAHYIPKNHTTVWRKDTDAVAPAIGTKDIRLNNINMQAMRDFLNRFSGVNNAVWYAVEHGFVAKFNTERMAATVTYKSNGEWLYTIKEYSADQMPDSLHALVNDSYSGYNIVHVQEISVPRKENNIYLVFLQNNINIKIVRMENGTFEVIHDYIKG